MHSWWKRLTLSSLAFWSSLVSSKRPPIAAAVRASNTKWAKPMRPSSTASSLWLRRCSWWPAQTRSAAAPPDNVANLLDPGDGAVEALQVVFVGGGELTRQVRELELDQVADLTELGQ